MVPFSAIITPQSVSFTSPEGKVFNFDSSHEKWEEIIPAIKRVQASIKWERETNSPGYGNPHGTPEEARRALSELTDDSKRINDAGVGRVTVRGGIVYYEGEAVRGPITERILWGLSEGFDMQPYMLFLDNSMENPSNRAVEEMYLFMEKHNMGITDDGYILGYKKVKEDFKDIYTGKMDNSPGQIVEMKRNKVDDNATRTCSHGLHFCQMSYLPHYGSAKGDKIVIVKVNPRDIVSVPIDYNHAKVRTCRYEVLSEYTGDDRDDLLGSKAVWSDSDFREDFEDEDDDRYDDDHYEDDDDAEGAGDHDGYDSGESEESLYPEPAVAPLPESFKNIGSAPVEVEIPVSLSEEGADMRHLIDTFETPSTTEGAAMRELIDVVDAVDGDTPSVLEVLQEAHDTAHPEESLLNSDTSNAVQQAFDRLVQAIEAKRDNG